MGDLEENARAVTGVALEPHAAAVLEVHQDGEGVVEDLVAALTLDARQGADAACIVFEFGFIEGRLVVLACGGRYGCLFHACSFALDASENRSAGMVRSVGCVWFAGVFPDGFRHANI